ncbi:MAG: hypothetical protein ABI572_02025 [Actinomycetota bacterium]
MRRTLFLLPAVMLAASFVVAGRSLPSLAVAPGGNGLIAFESDRDGDLDIFSIQPDGTVLTKLTQNTVADRDPAWSPDGSHIAFVRDGCTGTCRNLWVMNADGTGELQITNEPSSVADANPAWSPDGTTLVFAHPTNNAGQYYKQIWSVPAAGGALTQLTAAAFASWSPDWSPDGSRIVFTSTRAGDAAIYTMNADGSAQTKVSFAGATAPPAFLLGGPSWSPDGTTFAFHGADSATLDVPRLLLSGADGADTRTIYDPAGEVYPPSWAPNGNKLVVTVNTGSGAVTNMQVYVVNPSTGAATALAASASVEQNPSWQPGIALSPTTTPSASASSSASASGSTSASPPPPDGIQVAVTDDVFTPATVDIPRGGTLVFDHMGPSHHTATDATGMLLYDSGSVDESSPPTWYTFEAAGVYPFTCLLHPFMGGRARVPLRAAPVTGTLGRIRTVTWATGPAPGGFVFDVQLRRPSQGWTSWRKATPWPSASFHADAGTGGYRFRARLREVGVAASRWSPAVAIRVG